MKNRKVFLSGKVSGLPRWYVVIKFMIYDLFLTLMGYDVYNPVREIDKNMNWFDAVNKCILNLRQCDYIYFQFDWWLSKGSRIEMIKAEKYNIPILNDGYKIKGVYKMIKENKVY